MTKHNYKIYCSSCGAEQDENGNMEHLKECGRDRSFDTNNGGPAFPFVAGLAGHKDNKAGMTLRDWFAGQYLNGLAGNEASCGTNEEWAKEAYTVADAMLAERDK